MKIFKLVAYIILYVFSVVFILLSGYYLYTLTISIREGSQFLSIITSAIAAFMLNFTAICICLACIFSNRKMFLNVFLVCFTSAVFTIVQAILSIVMASTCSNDVYTGYRLFCDTMTGFVWIAPVIIDLVATVVCSVISLWVFIRYNKIMDYS
ncbi:MARVEL domain-containing protein [Entamoeba marina]